MGDRRPLDLALKAKQGHNLEISYFALNQKSLLHTPMLQFNFNAIFKVTFFAIKALKARKATKGHSKETFIASLTCLSLALSGKYRLDFKLFFHGLYCFCGFHGPKGFVKSTY